ncbi:MAG TPA: hypothetical protein VMW21_02025 [Patescibacteria group bacterium]|nr:hypothetical protein [Patescibacteria group bacterium]
MEKKKRNKKMNFEEIIEAMLKDRRIRLNIVKRSHKFFFYFYFTHYTEFEIAPFHEEMFHITQDTKIRSAVIVAFRGSSKSTIFSLSFPLWAILGEQRIKFVLILSQTQQKAQMLLQQIKYELETNGFLKRDLGPFQEERNQWNMVSLYLPRYNAKITIASTEQSVRGLRHKQYRPQLIICDDLEDMDSVKTIEGREKVYNWFMGEVLPAGAKQTRLMIVGSLLHGDSFIRRLQKNIESTKMNKAVYREYPIIDEKDNPTWPGKFPDQKAIDEEKLKGIDGPTWHREYLLKDVPDENQRILEEWFKEYPMMPNSTGDDYVGTFIGIDPAGSDNENADCTAMVAASIFGRGEEMKIYIHPNPINKRLRFNEIRDQAILLSKTLGIRYPATIIVEDVGIQKWLTQELKDAGIPVKEFKVAGMNKGERLTIAASRVQAGKVFFPKDGVKDLRLQLLNFGREKHDDLVDAFTMLILEIMKDNGGACSPLPDQGNTDNERYKPLFASLMNREF